MLLMIAELHLRYSHAAHLQSRSGEGEGVGDGDAQFPSRASEGSELALLHPSLFREPFDCLFPSQQADAHGWNLPEPNEKPEE